MSENMLPCIKSYLGLRNYCVNDSWLIECLEYFIQIHPKAKYQVIQDFVIKQYLLSDLRESNNLHGCLPQNFTQLKHTTLSGKYTLQLLKLYDISVSKFKQLEKIRNAASIDNNNIEVNKEESTWQAWEPTGKRMLQLFLTDGVQEIIALEHKPIRILNDFLCPGLKVYIIGPVMCRGGVIFLEETNIRLIDGEVEELLISNALENVLATALNKPSNKDPYKVTNKDKEKKIETAAIDFEDNFDIDFDEIEKIERSQDITAHLSTPTTTALPPSADTKTSCSRLVFPDDDESFFQDIEFEQTIVPAAISSTDFTTIDPSAGPNSSSSNIKNSSKIWQKSSTADNLGTHVSDQFLPAGKLVMNKKSLSHDREEKSSLPPKICDYISDILLEAHHLPSDGEPTYKSVRGKMSRIGKLKKKNQLWVLDGVIYDETGSIEVDFSSQFMESILGFSVCEFSRRKKKMKSEPGVEEELRKDMIDAQNRLQDIDGLLQLELRKGRKAIVHSFKELTENQRITYEGRLNMLRATRNEIT